MPKGEFIAQARAKRDPEKIKANMMAAQAKHCAKQNRKLVNSLRYIQANMPEPQFPGKTNGPAEHVWPKVTALTGGRTITRDQVEDLTLRLIAGNQSGRPTGIHSFVVRLRPFLPSSIVLNPNWFDWEDRYKDPKAHEAIAEFREWYEMYMSNLEAELLKYYMMHGEKFGKQYLTVLERRFRANWAVNSAAYQAKFTMTTEDPNKPTTDSNEADIKSNKVEFVFTTVESQREGADA